MGRKNHYASKSKRSTEAAAILYSLVETAKLNDIDPAAYLEIAAYQRKRYAELVLPWDL